MSTENKVSRNKKPSPELFSLIKAAASNLMSFGELWNSIKKKGHDEGFTERELQDILRPLLKPQLNKDQIYYLFNADEKKEQSKQSYHRNIPTVAPKKEPEQTYTPHPEVVAAKLKLLEAEAEGDNTPVKSQGANAFDYKPEPVEDPQALEIQFLKEKVIELEEALKKTQQFVPATELPPNKPNGHAEDIEMTDETVFQYLRDRATQTGDVIVIDRVGSGALAQALHQYKNSFGVAELFLRVIK